MAGMVLDGKALSQEIETALSARVAKVREKSGGRLPILATILVGDDPASATYVKMKGNACRRVGMESMKVVLPQSASTEELLARIDELNANRDVHGILLQHPAPKQIDERQCFERIALDKDVDGVTMLGFGRMAMGEPAYGSATPAGILRLLKHYRIPLEGQHAVVVGRSPILGKPVAMMLLNANATVTICHSKTQGLADIDGAVVVDAGYHPGNVGDVELAPVIPRCQAYTPVPGGVGPMTIATLMTQTVEAAEKAAGIPRV
jgi:methylenetetrahydrofolate dehydrogenase (NADP+)/methenyltetrahydrofolate cyclohydrolase